MGKDTTVYFEHGRIVKVVPEPECAYGDYREEINKATCIVSDGIQYDLNNVDSILSITTPKYLAQNEKADAVELGVTGYLEYVLRMHCSYCKEQGRTDLLIACLEKSTTIMPHSSISWTEKDYYRIVSELEALGRFDDIDYWEKWIAENSTTYKDISLSRFQWALDYAKQLGTDLIEFQWTGAQSAVVAKYQGRVYSISGKDKRFPCLPDFIKESRNIPDGLLCSGPILYRKGQEIFYKDKYVPIEKLSWRPFVDDRSETEKENYLKRREKIKKEEEYRITRRVYYQLKQIIPNDIPKSMSAFSRMKNSNSAKYQDLVSKAEAKGFVFPNMTVELVEPVDPEPDYNGKRNDSISSPSEPKIQRGVLASICKKLFGE